jgi:NADH:ubiquinone oxidoreductase subunit F (NADH-binding)/(2Fe-2S) ferredoxin/NAD-dependent dihydropyrimidine dehydrogenase PreA subunit
MSATGHLKRLRDVGELERVRVQLCEQQPDAVTLVVAAGTCGRASGALEVAHAIRKAIADGGLGGRVRLRVTGCHGLCQLEPAVLVLPGRVVYPNVHPEDMERLVRAAADGALVDEMLWKDPDTGAVTLVQDDLPFLRKQVRTIMGRNERVDPTSIEDYLRDDGYAALAEALAGADPEAILDEVTRSGLRGRGGAGFPTGRKWRLLAANGNGDGKFVVCNADEGDPGAYMDRSVLEGNPHSILEGMAVGAYATGATHGVVYVRDEYPLAVEHVTRAIEQARALGLLGDGVLGTGFSFDVSVVRGAGAFVCGEETALIRSIEGRPPEPRQRPPYPAVRGIHGKPTLINNVETWANVRVLMAIGADAYRRVGTPQSTGTKIFSLVGKVRHTGLVEVPMGIPIRQVVHEIGGDAAGNGRVKAVQTGGPSGGCIPAALFDLPVDYDSLAEAGAIMGSGGMIVMDEGTCMVDVARYFMGFLKDESCGKCFTCRKGTQRMYEILDDICRGRGTLEQLDLLEELAHVVKDTAMCGLGQTAPNPVLSTLRHFRDEYREHIENRRCPAGVCKELITYSISADCTGCRACVAACPADAITGQKGEQHAIDPDRCIRCGACKDACRFDAITVT